MATDSAGRTLAVDDSVRTSKGDGTITVIDGSSLAVLLDPEYGGGTLILASSAVTKAIEDENPFSFREARAAAKQIFDTRALPTTAIDAATTDASLRTLGFGAVQAAPGTAVPEFPVKAYGGLGNGENCYAAVELARAAAIAAGGVVKFHPGTWCFPAASLNPGDGYPVSVRGSGKGVSVIRPVLSSGHGIEISGAHPAWVYQHYEVSDLSIYSKDFSVGAPVPGAGSDADCHGLYLHDLGAAGPVNMLFRDIEISGFGGRGVYMPQEWTTRLEGIVAGYNGHNQIDISGTNTTVLIGCYATRVAKGRCGFRVRGDATLIACNGINNPPSIPADFGIFGQIPVGVGPYQPWYRYGVRLSDGEQGTVGVPISYVLGQVCTNGGEEFMCTTAGTPDPAGSGPSGVGEEGIADGNAVWRHVGESNVAAASEQLYFRGALIGCNLEDITRHGLRIKQYSRPNLIGCTVLCAPDQGQTTTIIGLLFDQASWDAFSVIDGSTLFGLKTEPAPYHWHQTLAIHGGFGAAVPIIKLGSNTDELWYDTVNSRTKPIPRIGSAERGYANQEVVIPRLAVDALHLTMLSPTDPGTGFAITPNSASTFVVQPATNGAFSILNPSVVGGYPTNGTRISIRVQNNLADAAELGVCTFGSEYELRAVWANPGAKTEAYPSFKTIEFEYHYHDAANHWKEVSRSL